MTDHDHKDRSKAEEFERRGRAERPSFFSDYLYFLRQSKKWWMLPLIAMLLAIGALIVLSSTSAAPFIYTLF